MLFLGSILAPPFTAAATAAKLLQSCPTLCDPIDGSPPSSVPGILQARILEWQAFPSSMHACTLSLFSRVWPSATPWTAAHQATLSTGFSRQEYWSGLPFPSPPPFTKSILICLCLCVFLHQLWLIKIHISHGHYGEKNEMMHKKHFT